MREDHQEENTFFEPIIDSLKTIFEACVSESSGFPTMALLAEDTREVSSHETSISDPAPGKLVKIEDFVDAYETQSLSVTNLFLVDVSFIKWNIKSTK